MLEDAGLGTGLDRQGEAEELVGLFVDGPFLFVEFVHLIEQLVEFREKFGEHAHGRFLLDLIELSLRRTFPA
jgi:hypothetical protein